MSEQKTKAEARAEYEKIRDSAWAEYEKIRAPAWAEYEKRIKEIEEAGA